MTITNALFFLPTTLPMEQLFQMTVNRYNTASSSTKLQAAVEKTFRGSTTLTETAFDKLSTIVKDNDICEYAL